MAATVKSINELIKKLKSGEIEEAIEILIGKEDGIKSITLRRIETDETDARRAAEKEISKSIRKVQLEKPVLSGIDFSSTNISGSNLSGLDLTGADFSYSVIEKTDLSEANLQGANFYKARISQANLAGSYGADMKDAYLTGSVNLYRTNEYEAGGSAYKSGANPAGNYHRYDYDGWLENMGKARQSKENSY